MSSAPRARLNRLPPSMTLANSRYLVQLAEQGPRSWPRSAPRVGLVHQPGMQAQLAQQSQRPEDREAAGVHVLDQAEDLLPFSLKLRYFGWAARRPIVAATTTAASTGTAPHTAIPMRGPNWLVNAPMSGAPSGVPPMKGRMSRPITR